MVIVGIFAGLMFVVSIYLMLRNNAVRDFRLELLARASQAAQDDISRGNFHWRWRYDAYESVSYDRMMLTVRRLQPENYYADTSFLELGAPRERMTP